jgi:hypothetical protein
MCFLNYSCVTFQATFLTKSVESFVESAASLCFGGLGALGSGSGSFSLFFSSNLTDFGFIISYFV